MAAQQMGIHGTPRAGDDRSGSDSSTSNSACSSSVSATSSSTTKAAATTGHGQGQGQGGGKGGLTTWASPPRARVVWVGNVSAWMYHDELRDIFKVALRSFRPDVKVSRVHVQHQAAKEHNSATVFLNRSVDLVKLQAALKTEARQPALRVKKCRNNKRLRKKRERIQHHAVSAKQAARAFVEYQSSPLPDEIGVDTPVFRAFVQELEEGREQRPRITLA